MAFSPAGLNALITDGLAQFTHITLHTADPGTTGASEVTGGSYARQPVSFAAASAGARAGGEVTVPVPAGVTVTHWGIRSGLTGGTFLYGGALQAAETFGSAGQLKHTPTVSIANPA